MRLLLLALPLALLAAPAGAAECTIARAIYGQPGSQWTLSFAPLPAEHMANTTAVFSIAHPGSGTVLGGEVYQPNGYSQSLAYVSRPCAEDEDPDICTLWNGTLYAGTESGIEPFPMEDTGPPPRQVLLPDFAATLWYSGYEIPGFSDDAPVDVFTFTGCAP